VALALLAWRSIRRRGPRTGNGELGPREHLEPQPDCQGRIERVFETVQIPALTEWTLTSGRIEPLVDGRNTLVIEGATTDAPVSALSPELAVRAGREYVFESGLQLARGQVLYRMVWNDSEGIQRHSVSLTPDTTTAFPDTRVFLRGGAAADRIRIEISDWSAATVGEASLARAEPLRLWRNK